MHRTRQHVLCPRGERGPIPLGKVQRRQPLVAEQRHERIAALVRQLPGLLEPRAGRRVVPTRQCGADRQSGHGFEVAVSGSGQNLDRVDPEAQRVLRPPHPISEDRQAHEGLGPETVDAEPLGEFEGFQQVLVGLTDVGGAGASDEGQPQATGRDAGEQRGAQVAPQTDPDSSVLGRPADMPQECVHPGEQSRALAVGHRDAAVVVGEPLQKAARLQQPALTHQQAGAQCGGVRVTRALQQARGVGQATTVDLVLDARREKVVPVRADGREAFEDLLGARGVHRVEMNGELCPQCFTEVFANFGRLRGR